MSADWAASVPQSGGSGGGGSFPPPPSPPGSAVGVPAARSVGRPSSLPDLLALAALVVSGLLALATAPVATLSELPVLGATQGWFAEGPGVALADRPVAASVLGYLLTPFGVVAALAWARSAGLRKLDDPWFDRFRLRAQLRRLQVAAILAFLLAVPHVIIIARAIQTATGLGA